MNALTLLAAKINAADNGIPEVGADEVVNDVLTIVYFAGGVTAVIVLIVCGILYSTSQGDAAKVKRAKDGILYSVVGLIVIMMAFVITNFIIGRF
jgi:hypothetical protein